MLLQMFATTIFLIWEKAWTKLQKVFLILFLKMEICLHVMRIILSISAIYAVKTTLKQFFAGRMNL
ncbi:hypothetical protein SDC9_96425 [bioreactor metagenome]|uniref:Uncharacterized protein n=1 Tax=bioreactor metagenome TaxID=1076179 RepID=A0A645A921_9ZZZZ